MFCISTRFSTPQTVRTLNSLSFLSTGGFFRHKTLEKSQFDCRGFHDRLVGFLLHGEHLELYPDPDLFGF